MYTYDKLAQKCIHRKWAHVKEAALQELVLHRWWRAGFDTGPVLFHVTFVGHGVKGARDLSTIPVTLVYL